MMQNGFPTTMILFSYMQKIKIDGDPIYCQEQTKAVKDTQTLIMIQEVFGPQIHVM